MPSITVTKTDQGRLDGVTDKDRKAYARFRRYIDELAPGEVFTLDVWLPRNRALHGLHFAMLAAIYDAQEQFADVDQLRMWLQVGAGWCEFVPGPTGRMVAIPKSISFRSLDDADFQAHHEAVKDFLRTEHARRFLWGHLDDGQSSEMVEAILQGFERV